VLARRARRPFRAIVGVMELKVGGGRSLTTAGPMRLGRFVVRRPLTCSAAVDTEAPLAREGVAVGAAALSERRPRFATTSGS
jgi:hypothetical protein